MRALVITVDDVTVADAPEGDTERLAWLQGIVGGHLQLIVIREARWHGYVNEDGLAMGLPFNVRAHVVARTSGWRQLGHIVGTAVFLGLDDEGEDTHVPTELIQLARRAPEPS